MYRCDKCKKISSPNDPLNKVVVETKMVQHFDSERRLSGKGTQIVREIKVCKHCLKGDL